MAADLPLHRRTPSPSTATTRPAAEAASEAEPACTISCSDCRLQGTSACDDCVVTFLLGPDESGAGTPAEVADTMGRHPSSVGRVSLRVVGADPSARVRPVAEVRLDAGEADVLRLLQSAGMAPVSRHERRVG